ncbi:hypothetical protein ACHAWO_007505 [Cyclotella atomus]|uniref:RRM domain-containing protein n=1 Tax=Cyclotella atomus TaxID=382360 RepID=A0ABD3P6R6_9STRA
MDDDLEAFFDDVDTAVKQAQHEDAAAATISSAAAAPTPDDERPSKRIKAAASSLPVKAVVASSVPVKSIVAAVPPPPPSKPSTISAQHQGLVEPIIPPPPPPSITTNNNNVTTSSSKLHIRSAAGQTWTDPTLTQWPENDFRLFVGNLPKDLKQHQLEAAFAKYDSFVMARIIYDKPKVHKQGIPEEGISRGYGFVSVMDPKDCARAIREMDQSWLGSRPIKVKRSEWREREWKEVKKKEKGRGNKRKGRSP